MANRIYNKQVSPKGYKRGGGVTGVKAKQSKEHKKKTLIRSYLKDVASGKYMDPRRGTAERLNLPRGQRKVFKKGGGSLKAVPAGNKGLKKLPTKVRNKMGFMKKGGKVSLETAKEIVGDIKDKKGKVHSTLEGQKASLKRFMKLGEKQGRFYPKKKEKKKKLEQN